MVEQKQDLTQLLENYRGIQLGDLNQTGAHLVLMDQMIELFQELHERL